MTSTAVDPIAIARRVATALESAGIRYFLGGSLASSLQGEPRSTNDIDFVVEMGPWHVRRFTEKLGADFSVDEVALAEAMKEASSANLFFLPSVMKIDLIACGRTPFDEAEFARRQAIVVGDDGGKLWIKTPEDSVLRKLSWFRLGGGVSERQWRDVVAVLRVGGESLDLSYLRTWAPRLGISDLLDRARAEAAGP